VRAVLAVTATVALVAVAGCGDAGGAPTSAATAATSAASSPAGTSTMPADPSSDPAENVIPVEVTIAGGQVDPPPARVDVRVGQTVRITVTSDEPDKLHVHGYDIETELAAGQPATVELVADQPGLFEVETHEQALQLFQLVVQ
jgi:plastocyanin